MVMGFRESIYVIKGRTDNVSINVYLPKKKYENEKRKREMNTF